MRVVWNKECERKGIERLNVLFRLTWLFPSHWLLRMDHLDATSGALEQGLSRPAQSHSILDLVFLFWDEDKLINSSLWPSMAFLLWVCSPLRSRLCQDFSEQIDPPIGVLGLVARTRMILKRLASDPSCLRKLMAHLTYSVGVLGLARDGPSQVRTSSNLRDMAVCDVCMLRISIVLRKKLKLEGFDFLGLT